MEVREMHTECFSKTLASPRSLPTGTTRDTHKGWWCDETTAPKDGLSSRCLSLASGSNACVETEFMSAP